MQIPGGAGGMVMDEIDTCIRHLSSGYTCDLLLTHPQNCSATEVESTCMCSQVPSILTTCYKKFNSVNTLHYYMAR